MADGFAIVAHKDGKWGGVCSTTVSKASLKEFLVDFAADGFTLQTVKSKEEYDALLGGLAPWHSAPVGTTP